MKTHVIYATTNPGKIIEIRRHFGFYDIPVEGLRDFVPVDLKVDEAGVSLGENAILKSSAYAKELSKHEDLHDKRFLIIADDTGVEIKGLNWEPGIKVRRWKGYKMGDEEIISYTLERLRGIKGGGRDATFRTVLSVSEVGEGGKIIKPLTFEGTLEGRIREHADATRIVGFPFESIFEVKEWNMLLGDLHRMSDEKKREGYYNHRERAIEKTIPYIKKRTERN